MKKNKLKLACAIFALLTLYTSCDLLTLFTGEGKDTEPTYTPNIAWTLETQCIWPAGSEIRYGQYLYIIESTYMYSPPEPAEFNIAKIDLETGKYVWKSPTVTGQENSSVIQSRDNLFIQAGSYLYCFNDADGALRATISIPSYPNNQTPWKGEILAYEQYLYWGNIEPSGTDGLMRFDTQSIDFSQSPTTLQRLSPELIWSGENWPIGALPIVDNGIIYAITNNGTYYAEESYSTLVAISADSNAVLWEKTFPFTEENRFPIKGGTKRPLHIEGDNIYVLDFSIGCYNKTTGETVYEVIQNPENLMHKVGLGVASSAPGVCYADGKFYFTNTASRSSASTSGRPEKYNKNIICIDAKNGKYVWGDMPPGSGSLETRPVVINGKCYVLAGFELRVYNANTGKLIGVDTNVGTRGKDRPHQYEDKFIYFDVDYANGVGLLTAIHAR